MSMKRKHAPSVAYRLRDIEDPQLKERLEMAYMSVETLRKLQVESLRQAQREAAMASKAIAETQLAEIDFIIKAGEAFDLISTEPNWTTRRDGEGNVLLECLLTQNDMQAIVRQQTTRIREQAQQELSEEDGDTDGLFGE